jgi:integrase
MVALYKRPGSPYWYFDVMVDHKRKRVSTKRTLKREAEAVAESYKKGMLDRVQLGLGVQELSVREALFDHYLPTRQGPYFKGYEHVCKKVCGDVPGIKGLQADLPFHELTTSMLRQYRSRREAQDVAPQTVDHELKVVSAAYHLVKADYRVRAGLEFPMARPKGKPRPLTPDEEKALLADLNPRRALPARGGGSYLLDVTAQAFRQRQDNYDLAVMLLDTGARFGEIAKLTWDTVDTIGWVWLNIYRSKVDNEGGLAITNRMREVLQRRWKERGNRFYVFPGWKEKGEEEPRQSTQAIRRAMKRVGINHPSKVERFGRRDVRSLRDTFATKLRRQGVSLDRIQKLLGHASPVMTQKYAHLAVDQASVEAADILNKLEGGT